MKRADATGLRAPLLRLATAVLFAAAALLPACAPVAPPPTEAVAPPAGFPDADYRQAAAAGRAVFRVEPAASLAMVEVRRGGSLAFIGHDHVVASHGLRGYVAPERGRADLYLRLDELAVDEAALRAESGFDTRPSAEDIVATRDNMLNKVLKAAEHPYLLIRVAGVTAGSAGGEEGSQLDARITLAGQTRSMAVPVALAVEGDTLRVSGRLVLKQSDFGIVPFAVLGGALQVQDALPLRFRIEARRLR